EQEQPDERLQRRVPAGRPERGHGLAAGQRGVRGGAEQVEQAVRGEGGAEKGVPQPRGGVGSVGRGQGRQAGVTHAPIVAAAPVMSPPPCPRAPRRGARCGSAPARRGGGRLAAGLAGHGLADLALLQRPQGVVAALAELVQLGGDVLQTVGELRLVVGVQAVDLLLQVAVGGGDAVELLDRVLLLLLAVPDVGRPGLVHCGADSLVGGGPVLARLGVGLLNLFRRAVVRGLLLDRGVGGLDLLGLRLHGVADLLRPGVQLLVAVVAAASRQRQYQYRTAGQCGRELLVHRFGPFHGSRPRNIHAIGTTPTRRTSDTTLLKPFAPSERRLTNRARRARHGRAARQRTPPARTLSRDPAAAPAGQRQDRPTRALRNHRGIRRLGLRFGTVAVAHGDTAPLRHVDRADDHGPREDREQHPYADAPVGAVGELDDRGRDEQRDEVHHLQQGVDRRTRGVLERVADGVADDRGLVRLAALAAVVAVLDEFLRVVPRATGVGEE